MASPARWLFGTAAALNVAVAAGVLFLRPLLGPPLHLDPVAGTNLVLANVAGAMIATFAYAYLQLARDPVLYRPYIPLAILGKLLVAAAACAPWLTGRIDWRLPALTLPDLVYAVLFFRHLKKRR